jgi:hypothetical protein
MFPLIETATAFAAVMLVVSLFVTALVQAISSRLRWRSTGLTNMLLTLISNYGTLHARDLTEADENAFVVAVVTHPLLHSLRPKSADGTALTRPVEYVDQTDLLDLVTTEMDQATERGRAIRKAVADVEQFKAFVERWYETVGATSSQHFKQRMRRLTLIVSCALVVIFNFDGFHLLTELHREETHGGDLNHQIEAIAASAARLGAQHHEGSGAADAAHPPLTEPDLVELKAEMEKTVEALKNSGVGIGWQSSFIVRQWRNHQERHRKDSAFPPDREMVGDALLWMMGLVFSCAMLSLGAPFWATTLGGLVNLTNAVQKVKTAPAADAPKDQSKGKGTSPDSDRPSA